MIKPVMTKEYEQIQVPTKTASPDSTNDQQHKEIDIRQFNVDDLKLSTKDTGSISLLLDTCREQSKTNKQDRRL